MKKFVFWLILVMVPTGAYSQDYRATIRSGVGYYMDLFTADDGPVFWLEGGYRLKTGFMINTRLSMSAIDWKINDGAFKGYTTLQLRQMADLTFSKNILLKGQHFLEPGGGFKIKREYLFKPYVENVYSGGTYYLETSYSHIFWEIGFTLYLDYYYQFGDRFYLGLRADANVIWALGFEGLTISPIFGFRF